MNNTNDIIEEHNSKNNTNNDNLKNSKDINVIELYKNASKIGTFKIDIMKLQRLLFINNALESGWIVKKKDGCYIFKKNHGNNQEVYLDSYLTDFLNEHLKFNDLLEL